MSNDFNRSLLHDKRIKNGLSMNALAEKLDVSVSQISKWENGSTKPRQKSIDKLSHFFGVTADYWESFYHEPKEEKITLQKPLNSFTPKPPVREEAREAFDKAVNPHEADKDKVRENLEKINNSFETDVKKVRDNLAVVDTIMSEKYKSKNQSDIEVSDDEIDNILEIKSKNEEIKRLKTEIQGLKCELEGLKVENARLQGNVDGLTTQLFLKNDDMKDIAEDSVKESIWKRIFG